MNPTENPARLDDPAAAGALDEAPPWPLQALLDAAGVLAGALAVRIGVAGAAVSAAARDGLTDVQADTWAVRLGTHPLLVWGWAWVEEADRAPGRPAYARLASALRHEIESGALRPGDHLPTSKAIAARWGVATGTATKAVAELRAEGLIVGGGSRGRRPVVAGTIGAGDAACAACGRPIDLGAEHYPHRPHCGLADRGWCDCDGQTHPECCPSCAAGAA